MADLQGKVFITIDFSAVMDFIRSYPSRVPAMLEAMAKLHKKQLEERFYLFSTGGGSWPELHESTIARKAAEGWPHPEAILIRSGRMSQSMSYRIHPNDNGYFVGFLNESLQYPKTYCKHTVVGLALIHHDGDGHNRRRKVVDVPTNTQKKALMSVAEKHISSMTRKSNQKRVVFR